MPLGYCQEANCIFIKNSTCKSRCCLFWRRVWDSPVCGRSGAAEKQSTGLFFNTRPSNPFDNITKKQHLHKTDAVYFGGGCGIRTHVGLLPNGFQDRLVMTASITLRMYVQVQTNLTFLIQFSRLRFDDPSSDFVPIILSHGGGFVKFSLCICGREVVY